MTPIQSFHQALITSTDLLPILSRTGFVAVHRSAIPYQDIISTLTDPNAPDVDFDASQMLPYIWYEIGNTPFIACISGDVQVDYLEVNVELVAFDVSVLDTLAAAFEKTIRELRHQITALCFEAAVELLFQDITILAASENYEPMNQIMADLGGFVRPYIIRIYPL